MRVIRIQLARVLFDLWGVDFHEMFEGVSHVEILEIYKYDDHCIFSKMKIIFNQEFNIPDKELPEFFEKKFYATYYFIVERKKNEFIVFMNQRREASMNIFQEYVWAIIPPISINKDYVLLSILIAQNDIDMFLNRTADFVDFKLLSNTKIEDFKSGFGFSGFTLPNITTRQSEIITYAIKRGYYDTPKKVSGKTLAKELNIEYATFYEHIRKIEKKIIKHFIGESSS